VFSGTGTPDKLRDSTTRGEAAMAIFILQGRFTGQYLKGGLAAPEDRTAAMSRLCEQAGGKLISLYYTLGQYDFALISEMPDAKSAALLPLVIIAGGAVTDAVTSPAFTTAEGKELFERAGRIVGSYKPMGAS
jgi:uncharacterized protein with GYD domain